MKNVSTLVLAILLVVLALASACSGKGGDAADEGNEAVSSQPSSTQSVGEETTGEKAPAPEPVQAAPEVPAEISAAHILIQFKGSARAPATVTRTQEEAYALAQSITKMAQKPDADFAALAKEYSDGPTGPRGGSLGNFPPARMVKPFSDATLKLEIGGVSEPVETQFGYHVIRRQELQVIPKVSAKHILVMYQGSMRAPASITRSKEEAYARCEEALKRVRAGEKFEDLAGEYSDGPTSSRGGDLGEFAQGVMAPTFDEAAFACEVGATTEIVETPFGYHIIYRYK